MKTLIFGDVYGRIGRKALAKELPILKAKYNPDFISVNVDNVTSGKGPIKKHVIEIEKLGVDIMTGGNHIYDNLKKLEGYLDEDDCKLLRPANFYESDLFATPGKGYKILEKDGKRLLFIHLLGDIFTYQKLYNPFLKVKETLDSLKDEHFDSIIVDYHKETSAEGYGLGFFLDGEISLIYGTHTHVQTNDEIILPNGTGLITDVGMNGPLYSVIGAKYESVKNRFMGANAGGRKIEQSLDKNYVVSAILVETNDETMKCEKIEKIRIRGELS